MICDECGKNEANFHYTTMIDGQVKENHLCEECVTKGYKDALNFFPDIMENIFSDFSNIMDGFQYEKTEEKDLKCDKCNMTYNEFRKLGKFGCSNCYKSFNARLPELFKSIHGDNMHRGKIPTGVSGEYKIYKERNELKYKLDEAVKDERFEDAAVLRDRLKEIDEKIKEGDF